MPLREEFTSNGAWLFRNRSYLPLLGLGVVLMELPSFSYFGGSHDTQLLWSGLCLAVGLLGLAVRIHVGGHAPPGTSARGTHAPKAARVMTTGFYSVVRHPLYFANLIMWLSIVMFVHVWWLIVLIALACWLYYERIMFVEEEVLRDKFGAAWLDWATRTPALLPRFRQWRAPEHPFSVRQALRREYAGFFALIATFTGLEITADLMVTGRLQVDPVWGTLFALALIIFVVTRYLTHHTGALKLPASQQLTSDG
ncbi:MAG: methyltransferase family protein [Terriglobales bacterium]